MRSIDSGDLSISGVQNSCSRSVIAAAKRLIIKIGSSLVTNEGRGLDHAAIRRWRQRPDGIEKLQAAAAIGQMGLAQAYESCFGEYGIRTAQILLTHADIADRERYLNARLTLLALLEMGVIS